MKIILDIELLMYKTIAILYIIHSPVFYLKHDIQETGLYPSVQAKRDQSYLFGQLNRFHLKVGTESSLRNVVL
jgi:hypothetical protein